MALLAASVRKMIAIFLAEEFRHISLFYRLVVKFLTIIAQLDQTILVGVFDGD